MGDFELAKILRSMDKACFRDYYWEFLQLPRTRVIALLMREQGWTEATAAMRVGQAYRIIEAGLVKGALRESAGMPRIR